MSQDIEWLEAIMRKYHVHIDEAMYNETTKHVKVYNRSTLLVVHKDTITPLTLAKWNMKKYIVFNGKMGTTFAEVELPLETDGLPNLWYHCDFSEPKKIAH